MAWKYVGDATDGDGFEIGGLAVWKHKWRRTEEPVVHLPEPRNGFTFTTHRFRVYEIGDVEKPVRFAAGEVCMNGWEFYVPDTAAASSADKR